MKTMTIDDFNAIRSNASLRNGGMGNYSARIVRKFVDGGYEAAEVEPRDFGRTERDMSKHTNAHMRQELGKKINEFGLCNVVSALTSHGKLYLVRCDI